MLLKAMYSLKPEHDYKVTDSVKIAVSDERKNRIEIPFFQQFIPIPQENRDFWNETFNSTLT